MAFISSLSSTIDPECGAIYRVIDDTSGASDGSLSGNHMLRKDDVVLVFASRSADQPPVVIVASDSEGRAWVLTAWWSIFKHLEKVE